MLKASIRNAARKRGYEIVGGTRAYAAERTLDKLLRQEGIDLVLDVGANRGQFALRLREAGYAGKIVSFEPQTEAHAALRQAARLDPGWIIADRTAVGAQSGTVTFHLSANSVSSSILNILPESVEAGPRTAYVGEETVPIDSLDNLCAASLLSDSVALKIDVQGYEDAVLRGARRVLNRCRVVIAEMSFVPLYEGQMLAREFWDLLTAAGFEAWAFEPGLRHPKTGRMLQMDGVFVRRRNGGSTPPLASGK